MDRSAPANSYSYKPWVPSEIEMLTQLWPDPLLTTPQIAARQQAARRAAKS